VTNVLGDKKHRPDVIGLAEFQEMYRVLVGAEGHSYYVKRNLAILCLLWLTGKRAEEVASVNLHTIEATRDTLDVAFVVGKKRVIARHSTRIKSIPLEDPYAKPVLEYYNHMMDHHADCSYLFPSTRYSNLNHTVTLDPDRHLSRTTVWRVVVSASEEAWPHLFRETVGARVVKRHGQTIVSLFAVKRRLDLERLDTAMRYLDRYVGERMELSAPLDLAASVEPILEPDKESKDEHI